MAAKKGITDRDAQWVWAELRRMFRHVNMAGVPNFVTLRWTDRIKEKGAIAFTQYHRARVKIVFLRPWWLAPDCTPNHRRALVLHEAAHLLCMLRGERPGHGVAWKRALRELGRGFQVGKRR